MAIAATVAIERFGGVVGGILATLPTTIVPAAWGLSQAAPSDEAFRAAMCAVPAGMLVDALFLWSWRALPPRLPEGALRRRLLSMILLSLGLWALGAGLLTAGLAAAPPHSLPVLGVAALAALVSLGMWATWRPQVEVRARRRVSPAVLLARGGLAALAIAAAVGIGQAGGELLAGMVSVFPAIFLTTMVSLWLAQGEAVPAGAVGPMMIGSSSVATYALLAAWWVPRFGPVSGGALAWPAAVLLATLPSYLWLRRAAGRGHPEGGSAPDSRPGPPAG